MQQMFIVGFFCVQDRVVINADFFPIWNFLEIILLSASLEVISLGAFADKPCKRGDPMVAGVYYDPSILPKSQG